jgi:hypothetical protein
MAFRPFAKFWKVDPGGEAINVNAIRDDTFVYAQTAKILQDDTIIHTFELELK